METDTLTENFSVEAAVAQTTGNQFAEVDSEEEQQAENVILATSSSAETTHAKSEDPHIQIKRKPTLR